MDEQKSSDHHEQFLRESDRKPNNLSGSELSEGSVSPIKKALRIKLKLYSHGDHGGAPDEEGQNHNRSLVKENRICKICKKGFGSGKALGGHMRIHAQPQVQEKQTQVQLQNNFPIPDSNNKKSWIGSYTSPGGPMNSKTKTMIDERSSNPSCSLCGKKFQSMKSLFGHMRCHPERKWRGIQPPTPLPVAVPATGLKKNSTRISSPSTLSDEDDSSGAYLHSGKLKTNSTDDDQLGSSLSATACSALIIAEPLPTWSVTAKRGRKAIVAAAAPPPFASASASEEQHPIPDMDAAYNLMMLANGKSHSNSQRYRIESPIQTLGNLSKRPRSDDDDESISQSGGARNSEYLPRPIPNSPSSGRVGEEEEELGSKTSTFYSSIIRGQPDESDQLSCMVEMVFDQKLKKLNRRKKKKMKLTDLERVVEMGPIDYKHQQHQPLTTTVTLSDRFKCRTCNKTFTSHQALGGHRSSHKITEEKEEEPESQTQTESPHRCKICNKTFQTGQALGGHQRCHWVSTAEAAPSSSVAPPPEDIISKTGRVMLDFDLNELPVSSSMEEDDEVINSVCFTQSVSIGIAITNSRPGQAAEQASSSNNSATETVQKLHLCTFYS
ncbi:uncharacterized protein LOC122650870 [Telopea speciosissima]|uniref:uncharacterized protein LOC122650870 n=1 Tax=Telopea speciosissima TaxID=54955 RepID=UPI001CC5D5A4|nr:uncharacterized protein LOC122650870 [Telopea speciosissima]